MFKIIVDNEINSNSQSLLYTIANDPIKVVEWNKAFMIVGHEVSKNLSEILLSCIIKDLCVLFFNHTDCYKLKI